MLKMIPEILYKYRSLDINTLEILRSASVWYSNKSQLNDPFDCYPEIIGYDDPRVEARFDQYLRDSGIESGVRILPEEKHAMLREALDNHINKCGVFCVSSSLDSELMWAHYADNHKGIAIGIKPNPENSEDADKIHLAPTEVSYDGRGKVLLLDFVDYLLNEFSCAARDRIIKAAYFCKNSAWVYENEYRLLSIDSHGLRNIEKMITSVTYGLRFDETKIDLVRQIIRSDVEEYRMELDSNKLIVKRMLR